MKNNKFTGIIFIVFILVSFLSASALADDAQSVQLWSRGDNCYLVAGSAVPVWPEMPKDYLTENKPVVMTVKMPKGFEIVAVGESTAFAVHPKPLLVPTKVGSKDEDGDGVVYTVAFPARPEELKEDNLTVDPAICSVRAALMIKAPKTAKGDQVIVFGLKTADGSKVWADLNATAHVLEAFKGKRPERLRFEVFDYAGYTNDDFRNAMMDTILATGINTISNMRYEPAETTIARQLREKGVKANWLIFWHKVGMELSKEMPELLTMGADGKPMQITDAWPVKASLCHTWCIENKDKYKNALVKYFKEKVTGRYDGIVNDNEEKAFTRDRKEIKGDLYTPITLELFRKRAGIAKDVKLTPEVITEKYSDQWVDFRCWQSASMSGILSEALFEVDPGLNYGYYSGHKYSGKLAGFTRWMYATDWDLLAEIGGLQFGASGYYGSTKDYTVTTEALGDYPHVPAEMFVESFTTVNRTMPDYNYFTYRMMNSLMYGSGGVAVWYLQVLDGAAFSSISQVSAIAAEIEDFLLDGGRCDDELAISAMVDKSSVFAYKLGEKRCVVIMNHSAKNKTVRFGWRKPINKPDTVELVTGEGFGASKIINAKLTPHSFAVYVTLSEGN